MVCISGACSFVVDTGPLVVADLVGVCVLAASDIVEELIPWVVKDLVVICDGVVDPDLSVGKDSVLDLTVVKPDVVFMNTFEVNNDVVLPKIQNHIHSKMS